MDSTRLLHEAGHQEGVKIGYTQFGTNPCLHPLLAVLPHELFRKYRPPQLYAQINIPVATFNSPGAGSGFVDLGTGTTFGPDSSWKVTSGSIDIFGVGYAQSPDGNQSVDVDGASDGAFMSTILIPTGGTVKVNFWLSGNAGSSPFSSHSCRKNVAD